MTRTKPTKAELASIEEYKATLRTLCKPGSTVYTMLRHVSSSGMSRTIDVYTMQDNEPQRITWLVGQILGYPYSSDGYLKVGGAGMDMGFSVVYSLSRTLWNDNFTCIGKGCPSNDHSNGDRNYEPHLHSDGGYALNHRWL